MTYRLTIGANSGKLTLGPVHDECLQISYVNEGATLETQTFLYNDGERIKSYFKDLSDHWKGWEGAKKWESVEKDFILSATHNRLGIVEVQVQLEKELNNNERWEFKGIVEIELGSLDDVVKKIETLFS